MSGLDDVYFDLPEELLDEVFEVAGEGLVVYAGQA